MSTLTRWRWRNAVRGCRRSVAEWRSRRRAWRRFWQSYRAYCRLVPAAERPPAYFLYPCLGDDTAETEIDLSLKHPREDFSDIVSRERPSPGQHFVEHTAERPDVGALVHGPASGLLGNHVRRGTENDSRAGEECGRRDRRR